MALTFYHHKKIKKSPTGHNFVTESLPRDKLWETKIAKWDYNVATMGEQ